MFSGIEAWQLTKDICERTINKIMYVFKNNLFSNIILLQTANLILINYASCSFLSLNVVLKIKSQNGELTP